MFLCLHEGESGGNNTNGHKVTLQQKYTISLKILFAFLVFNFFFLSCYEENCHRCLNDWTLKNPEGSFVCFVFFLVKKKRRVLINFYNKLLIKPCSFRCIITPSIKFNAGIGRDTSDWSKKEFTSLQTFTIEFITGARVFNMS